MTASADSSRFITAPRTQETGRNRETASRRRENVRIDMREDSLISKEKVKNPERPRHEGAGAPFVW